MEPLKLGAVTKKIIWGGERLAREYGKGTPGEKIAESWELTDRADGINIIRGGTFDGMLLSEYLEVHKDSVSKDWNGERFPLLIKLIDAEADLSIQVHPDDEYAAAHTDDLGKTEMWYIVDAAPDAKIIYGLKKRYTADELRAAIEAGTLEELMNYVPVKKGETYFIPSGMVHAICRGILIAEIQQNSNITYRVYDYNRLGADGNPRPLHIKKAAEVSMLKPSPKYIRPDKDTLASCKYFTVKHLACVNKLFIDTNEKCFQSIIVLDGQGSLTLGDTVIELNKGDSIFIPAQKGKCTLDGNFEFILSYV